MSEEVEARTLGWVPQEEWKGDASHWVDAKTFLERGRSVMPILQSNNKRLQGQIEQMASRMASMENSLKAANATIEALEKSHDEDVKEQVEAVRKGLKEELVRASKEGDHESVAELVEKLAEVNASAKVLDDEGGKKKEEKKTDDIPPEVKAWYEKNPTFMADPIKVSLSNGVATKMRQEGNLKVGAAFLDEVAEKVEEILGGGGGASKVSSGNGGSGRSGSGAGGGKTYADLPAEAKEVCERQAKRLVGPNRAHKDIDSWRKSYATQYFAQE